MGDVDGAIADFSAALNLDPKCLPALERRARAWLHRDEYANALKDLNEILRQQPDNVGVLQRRGLLLASCPDPKIKDRKQAIADIRRACDLMRWRDAESLSALADVYAELGELEEAVHWQKRAVKMAKDESEIANLKFYLESYQDRLRNADSPR